MGHTYKIDSQTELVHALKANDSIALKSFYTSNYHKVESFVLKNKGTKDQAKDVYQEAFIAVWKNVKNDLFIPKNETALQGYLYQIAKHKWLDVLGSLRFKKTHLLENEVALKDVFEYQHEEEQEVYKQKLRQAMDAFKSLGSPCKELLTTFYFEKKSLRDIAEDLNIEENTARNKKYRCMEKLRQLVFDPKS